VGVRKESAEVKEKAPTPKTYASVGEFSTGPKENYQGNKEATNITNAIELPELIVIARTIWDGKLPIKIKEHLRSMGGLARGQFFPKGEGRIDIRADLFENVEQAAATVAHEIGHLVDYYAKKFGKTMKRGNILGHMASLKKYMMSTIAKHPDGKGALTSKDRNRIRYQAKKLVESEGAERWIDEIIRKELAISPDDVLAIWNAVDQAKLLNPELYSYIAQLNTAQKKAIVKEAMKGIVAKDLKQFAKVIEEKTGKKVKVKLSPKEIKDLIKQKYADMINEEIKKRELFDNFTIMEELKSFSLTWKPFDPKENARFTKYRFSPVELYADAFSGLMMAPGLLKSHAPNFYEGFFNYLERKPKFNKIYHQIQDRINLGKDASDSLQRQRDMIRDGDDLYDPRRYQMKDGPVDEFKREFIDFHHMIIKRIKAIDEATILPGENPRYRLMDMAYTGSEAEWFMANIDQRIIRPLDKVKLDWIDLGQVLLNERISDGDRVDKANPGGVTPARAKQHLKELREAWNSEQNRAMEKAVQEFRDIHQEIIEKGAEAKRWDETTLKEMRNASTYVTFDVQHYVAERYGIGPSAKIWKQIGTFQDITNPATATVMKDIAMIKAINRQKAAESVTDFLQEQYPEEITKAKRGHKGMILDPTKPDQGMIVYLKEGKAKAFYVPKVISKSFESNPVEAMWISRGLSWLGNPFRKIFTELNPGFWLFNIYRDYFRAVTGLPRGRVLTFAKDYLKAIKPAYKSTFGIHKGVVEEMLRGGMLISVAEYRGRRAAKKKGGRLLSSEDMEIEKMLKRFHIRPNTWGNRVLKPFGQLFYWYSNIGRALERTTKIASYTFMKRKFPDMAEDTLKYIVRTRGGSPDFLRKGSAYGIYNSFFLFSNAIKEGYRGDIEAGIGQPYIDGKFYGTPLEFWWKKAKYILLPKVLQWAVFSGLAAMWLGDDKELILKNISEYDLANYHCIPLGLTETGKAVYLRIPTDETGRFMGGLFWKGMMLEDKDRDKGDWLKGLTDYMAGQAPTLNPGIAIAIEALMYATGRNPYNFHTGKYAIDQRIFKADDERTHKSFLKYIANKSGATIIHKFKTDDIDKIRTQLEEITDFPFVSNIIGRFVKVSDAGKYETIQRAVKKVGKLEVREQLDVRDAMTKWVNGEELDTKEKQLLVDNVDMVDRGVLRILSRRYGLTFMDQFIAAPTNRQKMAVFAEWFDRMDLEKRAAKTGLKIKKKGFEIK
jgi:hypothetical protein